MTISDIELNTVLQEINKEIRGEHINIPARPLVALSKLSMRYQMAIDFSGELAQRTFGWFDNLYGERLQIGICLGVTAVVIASDIYKLTLPWIGGTHGFVFDGGPLKRDIVLQGRNVGLSNIANNIQGLTPARVRSMDIDECNGIVTWFGKTMVARSSICSSSTQIW